MHRIATPLKQYGISLIEAMITVAVLITLMTIAVPSFQDSINERRITSAIENIYSDIALTRSEAIKQNSPVSIVFEASTASAWSYGLDDTFTGNPLTTDCAGISAATPVCTINTQEKVTNGSKFENVSMSTGDQTITFDSRGWTATNYTITVEMAGQTSRSISINLIGRIQLN